MFQFIVLIIGEILYLFAKKSSKVSFNIFEQLLKKKHNNNPLSKFVEEILKISYVTLMNHFLITRLYICCRTMLRLVSEVPVQEDTLMRVMIIGLTRELGVNAADALELADQLIRRAAMLSNEGTTEHRV